MTQEVLRMQEVMNSACTHFLLIPASIEMPEWLHALPQRFSEIFVGEKLAIATLAMVCLVGFVAAANRFLAGQFSWPHPRAAVTRPKRPKGFGLRHVVMILVALLPGGMVGMFTLYAIMGKENWRRDSLLIIGLSLLPAIFLIVLREPDFPWPQARDAIWVSGLCGLVFAMLQIWALIKLLRQWWGEPEECVPWWPPLTLWLQSALLVTALLRIAI
jgi:hypothetical protein